MRLLQQVHTVLQNFSFWIKGDKLIVICVNRIIIWFYLFQEKVILWENVTILLGGDFLLNIFQIIVFIRSHSYDMNFAQSHSYKFFTISFIRYQCEKTKRVWWKKSQTNILSNVILFPTQGRLIRLIVHSLLTTSPIHPEPEQATVERNEIAKGQFLPPSSFISFSSCLSVYFLSPFHLLWSIHVLLHFSLTVGLKASIILSGWWDKARLRPLPAPVWISEASLWGKCHLTLLFIFHSAYPCHWANAMWPG